MKPVIYQIVNRVNNKRYIGSTINLKVRTRLHFNALRKDKHHAKALQNAFNKYGEAVFVVSVLEEVCSDEDIIIREQFYLDQKPEYNSTYVAGANFRRGVKSTPEHCQRMSKSLKGRKSPMEGKTFSEEHKLKISEANKGNKNRLGQKKSEKEIEKIRQNHNPKSDLNLNRSGGILGQPHKKRQNTASQYKGVYRHGKKWRATFFLNKVRFNLGSYLTELEAAEAYNTKAKELGVNDEYLNKT